MKNIQLNNNIPILSSELIEKARQELVNIDYPTTKNESWKYTRVTKISKKDFAINENNNISNIDKFKIIKDSINIVFINGFFSQSLSSENLKTDGLVIETINEKSSKLVGKNVELTNEIFNSLNTVFSTGGVSITIKKNSKIDKPIQIINIISNNNTCASTRNIVVAEENTKAEIVQGFFSETANQTFDNHITEYFLKENASVEITKVQNYADEVYSISTEQVEQEKGSNFTLNTISLEGELIRNNVNVSVIGENCTTNLNGIYASSKKQHIDNHTTIDHIAAHCNSNELYKGIADGKSTIVFNGKVFVRPNAQKINAFQSNANVLLSDDASVNSKPELEIYADDVKCSHGSTTGQLDEEAVFYLQARGLSKKSATNLLINAFLMDVVDQIGNEEITSYIDEILETKLNLLK